MAVKRTARRRLGGIVNGLVYALSIVTIAAAVNVIAESPAARWRIDATKTRAYSLSLQTRRLLEGLEGDWTIAVVMSRQGTDPASREQIDEVLDRYTKATPRVRVLRIDPDDPATLLTYESLLGRLRQLYDDEVRAYDAALDEGSAAFEGLRLFAQQQLAQVEAAARRVDASRRSEVDHWPGRLRQWSEQGAEIVRAIDEARASGDEQPIPDYETARSILVGALEQASQELDDLARVFEAWSGAEDVPADVRGFASAAAPEYAALAAELADPGDRLRRLEPLELGTIGRRLAKGEAAVILGADRATVIPSDQLFPTTSLTGTARGVVAFDRRFRGEQVISAAIRSLRLEHMPMIVFAHTEDRTLLSRGERRDELVGMASILRGSRYEVREWRVGREARPRPADAQTVVWVIVPPSRSGRFGPEGDELVLLEETETLLLEGQPVLLNLYPSVTSLYGRENPWRRATGSLGVVPRDDRVVYESVPVGSAASTLRGQVLHAFTADHPICRAIHGQSTFLPLVMPLDRAAEPEPGARITEIMAAPPGSSRWLEDQWWQPNTDAIEPPVEGDRFAEPLALALAVVRRSPSGDEQRVLVVGSGGWMLSYAADEVVSIGGERVALTNPGNYEFALASIAWLAGHDDLIAPSPVSQQVARLDGVTSGVQAAWFAIATLVLPLGCLFVGLGIWLWRR